jgi:hypothetical protein
MALFLYVPEQQRRLLHYSKIKEEGGDVILFLVLQTSLSRGRLLLCELPWCVLHLLQWQWSESVTTTTILESVEKLPGLGISRLPK